MQSFKEFLKNKNSEDDDLTENAMAMRGHYDFKINDLLSKREDLHIKDSDILFKENNKTIISMKQKGSLKIYCFIDDIVVGQMTLEHFKNIRKINKIVTQKCYQVKAVMVHESVRRNYLAELMYDSLLKNGYSLIGDKEQYFGARRLWEKFSKTPGYKVSIFCDQPRELIYEDVELDGDDARVWIDEEDNKKETLIIKNFHYTILTLKYL